MNKTLKLIFAIVVVAIVAVSLILFLGKKPAKQGDSSTDTNQSSSSEQDQVASATITYDGTTFSPATVAVEAGSAIQVVNNASDAVEPSSDPHPVHTANPEINFGDIAPGESKTVTVTTKGTWGYHNHYDKNQKGTIVVE